MQLYGLIGNPLGHSFSQKYFTQKFKNLGLLNSSYRNFETPAISEILPLLKQPEIRGLNVTIPFKQEILPFLNSSTESVKKTGSCNCIQVKNNEWIGHNTDITGFQISLSHNLSPHHTKALVLGSGGSSASVEYVLQLMSINYLVISRTKTGKNFITYDDLNENIIRDHTLIVNTTPLGMYPTVNAYPKIPYDFITPSHYLFDLIYNPAMTLFLQKGEEKGAMIKNGYDMLTIQAEESWRIWNMDQ
ncbi:MAG: shikimate dehydrogenase [Chitinophagaceae bacterium]|nr:shikimate dehydrogenase [Chitinophagaceae bacterium]